MLRIEVAGPVNSGKTRQLVRIAADMTRRGQKVCLVNRDDDIVALHDKHEDIGGIARNLTVVREYGQESRGDVAFFDALLIETTTNREVVSNAG